VIQKPNPVSDIYFTSWQYVRIGGFDGSQMSSGASGVSWVGRDGKIMRPPCDEVGVSGGVQAEPDSDEFYLSPKKYFDDGIRYVSYSPRGIRLVAQQPTKIKFTDPLGMDPEGSPTAVSIVFDEGRYKCWYGVMPQKKPTNEPFFQFNMYLCYAESDDGFNWTKPKLRLFEYEGSKDNNVVMTPYDPYTRSVCCPSVFVDNYGDPAERYKMLYWGSFPEKVCGNYRKEHPEHFEKWGFGTGKGGWGLAGAISADGIRWKLLDDPMLIHFTDLLSGSIAYDPYRKQYITYHRSYTMNPASPEGWGYIGRRSSARSTSTNFRRWENTELFISTGADWSPSHVSYAQHQTWLPGCEGDQQVMFTVRWLQETDVEDICLYSTHDGWTWSAVPGGSPIVSPGEPGTWDGGHLMGGAYLVELPGKRWGLPYIGDPIPHKYPRVAVAQRKLHTGVAAHRGYAIWPKGRLVALECSDEGSFATVAVQPAGEKLFLNAIVEPAGYIKVGLRKLTDPANPYHPSSEISGRMPADCDAIWGKDALEIPVTWKGEDTLKADGAPVIVTFQMRRAKLFGLMFR